MSEKDLVRQKEKSKFAMRAVVERVKIKRGDWELVGERNRKDCAWPVR